MTHCSQLAFLLVLCCLATSTTVVNALEGRFVHLTDTHLLRAYGAGTDPAKNCIAGASSGRAGAFGDYKCDSPALVQNLTAEALKRGARPDFVLYGGDHVALKDPHASIADTVWFLRDIARLLRDVQAALGGVRVFPMLGNHDTFPFYQFPEKGPFYIYEAAADAWKDLLQPASLATVRAGGYYTELVEPGLRLVVVNTAMYFCGNWMFSQRRVDPGRQLAWLRGVLQSARDNHERVFLAAHVPPGASEKTVCFLDFSLPPASLSQAPPCNHFMCVTQSLFNTPSNREALKCGVRSMTSL